MRKVKFKDYVNGEWIEVEGSFHQWGESFDQCGEQIGKFTFAIVEDQNGKVHQVCPHDLQFLPEVPGEISVI